MEKIIIDIVVVDYRTLSVSSETTIIKYGLMRLRHMGWRRLKMISNFFAAFQRPFEVLVNFDGADSATNRLQGFQLTFTQSTSSCV